MRTNTLNAALALATGGYPVFPCSESKKPTTPNGFKNASAEPEEIRRLWHDHPGDLIGVPTGNVIGLGVLDVDLSRHQEARDWWQENRHRIPRTRIHRTGSGGLHLLFQHDGLVHCTAGKIKLGVDTRGNGGYIIHWPSHGLPILSDAPPAPWPDWLLAEFRPKPRPPSTASAASFGGGGWLRGLVRTVANAAVGTRNATLFWASCRAAERVRDGSAAENFVIDVLLEAAAHTGLPEREAQRTIRSGMDRHE
jgi:hypothetical protein